MSAVLEVPLGRIVLKNPLICGAGEHLMTASGIRAALDAGAAAVVAKSTNESAAAREQLDRTDYVRIDERLQTVDWGASPDTAGGLLGRSGLVQCEADEWLALVAELDAEAAESSAYVVGSLIPADPGYLPVLAGRARRCGLRVLEVNLGAPHAGEAEGGAILHEKHAEQTRALIARVRDEFDGALWVKLTGMSEEPTVLAAAARDGGADAVIMMGRVMGMLPDLDTHRPVLGTNGAYGGRWALPITCRWLAETRGRLGPDYPLIGTNGARDGLDIARMMLAGAHAVQLCTAIMVEGFGCIERCLRTLTTYLHDQHLDARALVGVSADKRQSYAEQSSRPGRWRSFVPPDSIEH